VQRTKRLLSDFIPSMDSAGPMTLEEARKVINETAARRGQQKDSRVPALHLPQVSRDISLLLPLLFAYLLMSFRELER
jgi:hypothetical protein